MDAWTQVCMSLFSLFHDFLPKRNYIYRFNEVAGLWRRNGFVYHYSHFILSIHIFLSPSCVVHIVLGPSWPIKENVCKRFSEMFVSLLILQSILRWAFENKDGIKGCKRIIGCFSLLSICLFTTLYLHSESTKSLSKRKKYLTEIITFESILSMQPFKAVQQHGYKFSD